MNLIIVESPTKARTLSKFLGKEFGVEATMGHVKDLPKSNLGVDVENNFKPHYEMVSKKKDSVRKIKNEAKKAKEIYLATDPDREGEAIASHVREILMNKKANLKRIVFHEITKNAVEKAIEDPKEVDKSLVHAQIARRVLDRLVGYKLSPLLWKKVRKGLSAGRVQSVAVKLIVEKEREIEAFKPKEYWEIFCEVSEKRNKKSFDIKLARIKDKKAEVGNEEQAKDVVSNLEKSKYKVFNVIKKEVKRKPYTPFTTSTMTQTASRFFGWSARKTMSVAQRLYERGFITYHRTDSVNLSSKAVRKLRRYIKKEFGEKYVSEKARQFKTKSKVAQEAHEAIRPTNVAKTKVKDKKFQKDVETLYNLVWKRFVACQMSESVYDRTKIEVEAKNGEKYLLRTTGRIMKFDGWRKVIPSGKEEKPELPDVKKGQALCLIKVKPEQKFTKPPARYNEASLIKTLEKLEIGRPSTYAPIIYTIQKRQYVEKEEKRFKPTPVGITVNDFLIKNFPKVFDYSFTADMENDLDEVANGNRQWEKVIKDFWNPFENKLEKAEKKDRVKIKTEKLGKKCSKCKKGELVIRLGKYGKFVSCSRFPDCDYTERYLDKIGMKCPDCKKGDVIIKTTRRGRKFYGCSRFPKCKWASWKNPKAKKD